MILIAAVDERYGMAFNKRRQSSDRAVTGKIIEIALGSRLWMNAYSFKLFKDARPADIQVDEDFLKKAGPGEFCFAETVSPGAYLTPEAQSQIERIVLFKWNRRYPGDVYFDIDLGTFKLVRSEDFAGNSHEKITMEIYESRK